MRKIIFCANKDSKSKSNKMYRFLQAQEDQEEIEDKEVIHNFMITENERDGLIDNKELKNLRNKTNPYIQFKQKKM